MSIGTNDFIQYTLAIDRADHEVAHLYDDLHPAILQLLQIIVSTAEKAGFLCRFVAVWCRRFTPDPLIGRHGIPELSMPAALLPEIKQAILNTRFDTLQPYVKKILRSYDSAVIQETLGNMEALGKTLH